MKKTNTRLTLRQVHGPLQHVTSALAGNEGVYWYLQIRDMLPEKSKKFLPIIGKEQKDLLITEGGRLIIYLIWILMSAKGTQFFEVLKKALRKENSLNEISAVIKEEQDNFSGEPVTEFLRSVLKESYSSDPNSDPPLSIELTLDELEHPRGRV